MRSWLFPVVCFGCEGVGQALCEACRVRLWEPSQRSVGGVLISSATIYAGVMADVVRAVKRGERAPLDGLAALLAEMVPPQAVLVPAVTSRRRVAQRGFDQARELAFRVAKRTGASVADVLEKRGRAQHGSARVRRLAQAQFSLRDTIDIPPEVFLVDDVATTGATIVAATRALTNAGCRVLGAVVVATPAPRDVSPAPASETSRRDRESLEA